MIGRLLELAVCPGCLCLRFGPGHLLRRALLGTGPRCRNAGW